jgi:hypothetical protein
VGVFIGVLYYGIHSTIFFELIHISFFTFSLSLCLRFFIHTGSSPQILPNMINTFQHSVKQKHHTLYDRIGLAIQTGKFATYSTNQKQSFYQLLLRHANCLMRWCIALVSATVLFFAPMAATGQTFTEQITTENAFNGVDVGSDANLDFVDIDNDGDKDVFIGRSDGTIAYYKNTGSNSSPIFTEQTGTSNPFNGIDIGDDTKPSSVDIDNDGDYDIFIGENTGTIKYYMNTGNNITPAFTEQTGTSNPFNAVDIGSDAAPTFIDIDNDLDFDAFISESNGAINYYKNTGNNTTPTFTEQTGTSNLFYNIDVGADALIALMDIDNDGDEDAFIGENDGVIYYYQNTGNGTTPVFTEQTGTNNPFNGVDMGTDVSPAFVDIDNDGDFDSFIGENNGTINYYKNTGNSTTPIFTQQINTANPLSLVDVGSNIVLSFIDIDNDGDADSFIGENNGNINYFQNTGSTSTAAFVEKTSTDNPFNGIDVGSNSAPSFIDIDNDSDFDAFIGESDGAINYYKNTGNSSSPAFTETTGTDNPFNGVDVGDNAVLFLIDIDNDGDKDAFIGESDGTINYYKNTGNSSSPVFTETTGTDNPFNGVDVGDNSTPSLIDIDIDGDKDAFIGTKDGTIYYYKNTGNSSNPIFTVQTGTDNPFNGVDVGDYATPAFVDIDNDSDFDAFIGEDNGIINYYKNTTAVLPVEFIFFSGYAMREGNLLTWTTATEENNAGFEVQKSTDGRSFEKIAFVAGNGTTTEEQTYEFLDKKANEDVAYYRLKQLDFDGKFEYSKIISLANEKAIEKAVLIYPNPVTDKLNIIVDAPKQIEIVNSYGQLIYQQRVENSQIIDMSDLPNGFYFLKAGEVTKKFVLQR